MSPVATMVRRATLLSVVAIALVYAGSWLHRYSRTLQLKEFAARQSSLIAAIDAFQRDHGHAPPDLASLDAAVVLPQASEADICSSAEYLPGEATTLVGQSGNAWMLVSYCRTWSVDHFVYLPNQKYPPSFERIGAWGYHHG